MVIDVYILHLTATCSHAIVCLLRPTRDYVLNCFQRLPRDAGEQFPALVYFSAICPTGEDGRAPTGIEYHELSMTTLGT